MLNSQFLVKSVKSTLHSVLTANPSLKNDCQSFKRTYHRRTHLPESGALYPIEVAILKMLSLTIDTSGTSLFKRGYRN